jgi:hypothetical protein
VYLHYPHTEHHASLAGFIEESLPVQMLAHLTFPYQTSREKADLNFLNWTREIQAHNLTQLGYIVAYEQTRTIPLHLHAALITPRALEIPAAREAWFTQIGRRQEDCFEADQFKPGQGGIEYLLKAQDEDCCDLRFSNNIALFSKSTDPSTLSTRDRRRHSRIWSGAQTTAQIALGEPPSQNIRGL